MSEFTPELPGETSQESIRSAENAEQAALNAAQNDYLLKRVVILRVQVDSLRTRLSDALAELETLRPKTEVGEGVDEVEN